MKTKVPVIGFHRPTKILTGVSIVMNVRHEALTASIRE
jgi:hypothetical protein